MTIQQHASFDSSAAELNATSKLVKAWESKNAKNAAKAGGVSLMALSLAACGGSSTTTTTPVVETPVVDTPAVAEALSFTLTSAANAFTGGDGADSFTAATAAVIQSFDTLDGGAGIDTLTITDVADAYEGATGVGGTISNVEGLAVTSSGGFGTVAADATTATAVAQVVDFDTVAGAALTAATHALTVTVNGVDHATTYTGHATTGATAKATAIKNVLVDVLGGTATVSSGAGTVTITSAAAGVGLPTISATEVANGASAVTNALSLDTTNSTNKDNVVGQASAAQTQIVQIVLDDGSTAKYSTSQSVDLYVDGVSLGSVTAAGLTTTEVGDALVLVLNNQLGAGVAVNVAGTVTITAPTAGVALPHIGATLSQGNGSDSEALTVSVVRTNTTLETAATDEVVFDASGFSGEVNLTADDDVVVKAAATAAVTISSSAGSVDVDGGATVNVTGTGAVDIMGDKITSATVKTGTGTGDTVTIGATTGTTADTPLLESASVTGGTTITVIDEKNGASSGTLTKVDLAGIGGTATLTGKALTEVNLGAQTTSQTINVVNAATTDHVLSLSVADTGIDADAAAQQVTIVDDSAKTVALTVNGTDNDILIDGDTSLTTLTVTGAGAAGIALHSSTAVTSIDASAATGNIDLTGVEAVAITVKTGAGDDTFTTAATAAMTVDAGAGDDTVTFGSAVAKGSTVDLGAGDDTLLTSSGSVATDDATTVTNAKITLVDGGSGTDTLAASFITAGNADQFANFEILGLDKASGSLDSALISGITGLELLAGGGTYTNVELSDNLTVATTGMSGTTTLTFATAEVSGASDSYTITFSEQNAAERTAEPTSGANVAAGTVVTAGVENINIVSGGVFTHNDITLGANDDAETVTITGAQNLDIAFASGFGSTTSPATGVSLIDGSGATGDLAVVLTNVVDTTTGLEVKTGSGDDTVTTAAHVTTITGGAGENTFVVAGNTITSAAGTATAAEVVSELVTITDFKSGDSIDFISGNTTGTLVATDAVFEDIDVSAATSLLAATAIAAAGGGADSSNTDISVDTFEYNGDTYVLYDATTKASTDMDTGDILVKLTGTGYDFADATLDTGGVFTF
ncbi:hypothetical protein N8914_01215 [Planktomarina temperata]|nr:hypothetical protein [Planktomarina temperata]